MLYRSHFSTRSDSCAPKTECVLPQPSRQLDPSQLYYIVVSVTLSVLILLSSFSNTVAANEFQYVLKAQGTESPIVSFEAELTATGTETVVTQEDFSKHLYLRDDSSKLAKDCSQEGETLVCLPSHCEVDYSKGGGKGYDVTVLEEWGIIDTRVQSFDPNTKCLYSRLKICTEAWWGSGSKYDGYHIIYGKCNQIKEWSQTQPKATFSLKETDGFVKLGEYTAPINSTVIVNGYNISSITNINPMNAVIQSGMFKDNPTKGADNGSQFWAKTTYRLPWNTVKTGIATVPTDNNAVPMKVDFITDIAPNNDTTYSASIVIPPCISNPCSSTIYEQDNRGVVNAVYFMGWLSGKNHDFYVSKDMNFKLPSAVIDGFSPNPALIQKNNTTGIKVSLSGHGEYGTNTNPPIAYAEWESNRVGSLGACPANAVLDISTCNINYLFTPKDVGQHLITFLVSLESGLISPYTMGILKINIPPTVAINKIKSTGEKDGVINVVEWKDKEFDPNHDLITFEGQAIDLDSEVVEYKWESDRDGILSNLPSFTLPASDGKRLSLGKHKITFSAKDESGAWSNIVTRTVNVMKPPVLLVHGFCGGEKSWDHKDAPYIINYGEGKQYDHQKLVIEPNNARVSYGAKKVAERIRQMTEEYGVPKVNIIAHSMGGLNARWYIENAGYAENVNKLVMLGTPNHGATVAALSYAGIISGDEHTMTILGSSEILNYAALSLTALGGLGFDLFINADCYALAPALFDLIPQSSTLRSLNGNHKDEGCHKNNQCGRQEPMDDTSTVYGDKSAVQYFLAIGNGNTTISHHHGNIFNKDIVVPVIPFIGSLGHVIELASSAFGNPTVGKIINEILQLVQWVSLDGDWVVHEKSAMLDNIPYSSFKHTHSGLRAEQNSLAKAYYYLGDDPPTELSEPAHEDITKILASQVLYAPQPNNIPAISTGGVQQNVSFNVDADTNLLHVMLMVPTGSETAKLNLNLLSPSGDIIKPDTTLQNVIYSGSDLTAISYHIINAPAGLWTAEVSAISGQAVKYVLFVTSDSDFWVGVSEGTQVEPGQPFKLTAYAQKDGQPASGLIVKATLVKTLDEGQRIGSKYGDRLRDTSPLEFSLVDNGNGMYELPYIDTEIPGVYRVIITATNPVTNTSRVVFTTYFVEYDYKLSVQNSDIVFSNDNPKHGESITVSAKIRNDTGIEAKGVEVWFSNGSLGEGGIVYSQRTIDIPANGETQVSAEWKAIAGNHELFVIVSPINQFIEQNTKDNVASKIIAVVDNPPVAYAGIDQIVHFDSIRQANSPVFLDGGTSSDELEIERYEWDIDINRDSNGDGIPDNDIDLLGVRPFVKSGSYPLLGEYTVKLTVFDSTGHSNSDTLKVKLVEDYDVIPPSAEAGMNLVADVRSSVHFNGSASTDNYSIALYTWDVDTLTDSDNDGISSNDIDLVGINPVLKKGYATDGIYTAKLTVTDAAGNEASSDTVRISVGKVARVSDDPVINEVNYTLHGVIKDAANNPISGIVVQVGDKTTVTDGAGNWEIGELLEGTYEVIAAKDGFACLTSDVELGNQQYLQAVNCEPVTSLKAKLTNQQWGAIPQGQNLSYTVTLFNGGETAATGIKLAGKFPDGVTIAKFEGDTAVCDSATATCTVADLAPGTTATLSLELSNLPANGQAFMNALELVSNEYPADVVKSWRKVKPYLSLLGKAIPNPVVMGGKIHYTLAAELLNTAPELTATAVKAEIRLPNELKFLQATTAQGTCENVGNTITCNLGDLSVENSDSISRVDIRIDAELGQDLVQLNAETKMTASNYPEHHEIVAVNTILGDGKVDGIILLDVTASMGEELQAVINAVKAKLNQQFENAAQPVIALVTFRDSVKIEVISDDLTTLLKALEKLEAKDGGTCPEASAQALDLALDHIKPNGTIIFVTDAPPYEGTDIEALQAKIVAKQAKFVPIVTTSDCATNQLSSPQP